MYPDSRAAVKAQVCHYIDVTKDLQGGEKRGIVDRGVEVQEWLDRHPAVEQYAIIDDDSDFLPNQWLFKTSFNEGLTPEIAAAVIHHLNAKDNIVLTNSR